VPAIGGAAAEFAGLAASVTKTTVEVQKLTVAATAAATAVDNIGKAMDQTSTFMKELKSNLSLFLAGAPADVSDPGFGQHDRTAQEQTDANKIVADLTTFQQQLVSLFGSNNQFATFIGNTATSIQGGADPYAALNALRAQFSAYAAGLQQELFSDDPNIRAFAAEMERFISGGNLN